MFENGSYDYMLLAFFAAFLGWQAVRKKATGYLWFLLPLALAMGMNMGWATALGTGETGKIWFVGYRVATVLSCVLAGYMYYRDYHKRKAEQIKENTAARKAYEAAHPQGNKKKNGNTDKVKAEDKSSSYKIYPADTNASKDSAKETAKAGAKGSGRKSSGAKKKK